jgi:hypothetical protein
MLSELGEKSSLWEAALESYTVNFLELNCKDLFQGFDMEGSHDKGRAFHRDDLVMVSFLGLDKVYFSNGYHSKWQNK